jgi:transcriptional regulator with XRE-family HTH domain
MQTIRNIFAQPSELEALGHIIRRTRRQQNISFADLARALGIAGQRLEAIEGGREDPEDKLLRMIAGALGITSGALLTQAEALQGHAAPDLSVKAMLARHGERALTSTEFQEYFGELPTDGEG